jgi:hypothetical protein
MIAKSDVFSTPWIGFACGRRSLEAGRDFFHGDVGRNRGDRLMRQEQIMTQMIERIHPDRARSCRMAGMKGLLAALFIGAEALQAPALEQGTADERRACMPDVLKLCSEFIPDRDRITACLQQKANDLSPTCRMVVNGPPPVADRR